MDLLIRIPYTKPDNTGSVLQIVKSDMTSALRYMIKENPIIAKTSVIAFYIQISLVPMVIVGVPVLITQHLGYGMDMVGYNQSIMMVGGLVGGILAGALGERLKIKYVAIFLFISTLFFGVIGIPFFFPTPAFPAYIIITIATALALAINQLVNIPVFAFIQAETPSDLMGKVMSFFQILPFVAMGSGSLIYGFLYDTFDEKPWIVIFGTVLITVGIAIYAHKIFKDKQPASSTKDQRS